MSRSSFTINVYLYAYIYVEQCGDVKTLEDHLFQDYETRLNYICALVNRADQYFGRHFGLYDEYNSPHDVLDVSTKLWIDRNI